MPGNGPLSPADTRGRAGAALLRLPAGRRGSFWPGRGAPPRTPAIRYLAALIVALVGFRGGEHHLRGQTVDPLERDERRAELLDGRKGGTVRNSVYGRAVEPHQPARAFVKRSPKRTANWALAIAHSPGGI